MVLHKVANRFERRESQPSLNKQIKTVREGIWKLRPCYIDPTISELEELHQTGWETIRIMASANHIAMASGHGHTHTSIIEVCPKEWASMMVAYILFKDHLDVMMNCTNKGGPDKILARIGARKYLSNIAKDTVLDFIGIASTALPLP